MELLFGERQMKKLSTVNNAFLSLAFQFYSHCYEEEVSETLKQKVIE